MSISDETIFCIETGKWLDLEEIIQEYSIPKDKSIEKKSKKKLSGIKKKICNNYLIIIGSFREFKIKTDFLDFLATSLIIIIGFYLLASTIAPLVNFANQTFRIVITIIGGIPSIFYYSKTYKEKLGSNLIKDQ